MGLKKGHTNNPDGRPKGTQNRTTQEIKQLFVEFLDKNIDTMQKDFERLEPKDRLYFIEKMAKLILPAPLQQIEHRAEDLKSRVDLLFPSEDEILSDD
jgi:hypothetical protein